MFQGEFVLSAVETQKSSSSCQLRTGRLREESDLEGILGRKWKQNIQKKEHKPRRQ